MKKSLRKVLCLIAAVCLMAAVLAPAAFADDDIGFPAKETITLVVPGKAGGGSDLAIRYYAQALTDLYGLRTTVTNYDSNTIGHQTVKSAKPDGTVITLATGALNIQYVTGNSDIDPMNDFTLIAAMQDNGYSALAVPTSAPYDDFAGFVEYAKEHPGELNVGMPAAGANTFLFGQLTSTLGIELNPVEMSSESDRLTNLAGGFIDIGVLGIGNGREYEQAGKLKVIGTVASDGVTIALGDAASDSLGDTAAGEGLVDGLDSVDFDVADIDLAAFDLADIDLSNVDYTKLLKSIKIPGFAIDSILDGIANTIMTLRIGYVTKAYLQQGPKELKGKRGARVRKEAMKQALMNFPKLLRDAPERLGKGAWTKVLTLLQKVYKDKEKNESANDINQTDEPRHRSLWRLFRR